MHHFAALVFVFLVPFSAEIVFGAVPPKPPGHQRRNHCLATHEAEGLRDLWISFFTTPGVDVRNSVTDDFKFFSESLNSATPGRSLPLDAPAYDGKEALVQAAIAFTSGPILTNVTTVAWDHGCDTFTFRWYWEVVPGALPIAGVSLAFVQKGSYLLEKVYSEFNNVLYLSENGCKFVGGPCGINDCGVCEAPKARDLFM